MAHIYKFRILLEDNDQFFREIDIKANQTFEDFHKILISCAGFDGQEMASFYLCDSKWNKLQEICLCDMQIPDDEFSDEDDDDRPVKKQVIPVKCMKDTVLKDMIIDPHQRIIYVYDFLRMHTFYIELYKIFAAEAGKQYPMVVKSKGKLHQIPSAAQLAELENDDEEVDPATYNDLIIAEDGVAEDEMFEGFYDDSTYN
jgi:hypothetical protein